MSRARPILGKWFDVNKNGIEATDEQLELLATVENVDLDELLDADLTQGEVIARLRLAIGDTVPESVIRRREALREERKTVPECRICGKKGDSTRHHFVNKWILKELATYSQKWADRSRNCIPLCIHCHREVHSRSLGTHSIVPYLTDKERQFAEEALTTLSEERPKILILLARGDSDVYETRLVRDWIEGKFS